MRYICIVIIAICIISSSPVLADPLDNTNEFIQKMANEGESQNGDEVSQPEIGSPIEWGDDETDDPDQRTDQQSDEDIAESAKIRDEGQARESNGK